MHKLFCWSSEHGDCCQSFWRSVEREFCPLFTFIWLINYTVPFTRLRMVPNQAIVEQSCYLCRACRHAFRKYSSTTTLNPFPHVERSEADLQTVLYGPRVSVCICYFLCDFLDLKRTQRRSTKTCRNASNPRQVRKLVMVVILSRRCLQFIVLYKLHINILHLIAIRFLTFLAMFCKSTSCRGKR